MYTHIHTYICVYIHMCIPCTRALPLRAFGANSSPAPELVLWKLILQRVTFSGGVCFILISSCHGSSEFATRFATFKEHLR